MNNPGIENEYQIMAALNGKTIEELNDNFREPVKAMFKYHKEGERIVVRRPSPWIFAKTDIEIEMYGHYHNVSIKCGFGPAVHQEEFDTFLEFLKSLNISNETIDTIKLFHFQDGTLDGSSKKSMRLDEFKDVHKDRIAKANQELQNPEIIKAIVHRCVIKGTREKNQEINYLYYGNAEEGIFIPNKAILEYAKDVPCYYPGFIHFGPFVYNQKIQTRRVRDGKYIQFTQIVWPNIKEGVLIIKKKSMAGVSPKELDKIKEEVKKEKLEQTPISVASKESKVVRKVDPKDKKTIIVLIVTIIAVIALFIFLILTKTQ